MNVHGTNIVIVRELRQNISIPNYDKERNTFARNREKLVIKNELNFVNVKWTNVIIVREL